MPRPSSLGYRTASPYSRAVEAAAREAALTLLRQAIHAANGHPDAVAAILGLTRSALYRELRRWGVTVELDLARASATVAASLTTAPATVTLP